MNIQDFLIGNKRLTEYSYKPIKEKRKKKEKKIMNQIKKNIFIIFK